MNPSGLHLASTPSNSSQVIGISSLQKALRDLDGIWMPASFCLQLIMQVSGVFPEYLQHTFFYLVPCLLPWPGGAVHLMLQMAISTTNSARTAMLRCKKEAGLTRYGLHVPQIHGVNIKFADWKQFLVWPVIFTWTTTKTAIGHTISTRNCAHTSNHNLPPSFSLYTSQK